MNRKVHIVSWEAPTMCSLGTALWSWTTTLWSFVHQGFLCPLTIYWSLDTTTHLFFYYILRHELSCNPHVRCLQFPQISGKLNYDFRSLNYGFGFREVT